MKSLAPRVSSMVVEDMPAAVMVRFWPLGEEGLVG